MNILTDVLSLIRRSVYAKTAGLDDVLILGVNEQPEMTGVASPIPYKSVKVIKVRDFKVAAEHCDYTNSPAIPAAGTGQVYQKTVSDEVTEKCTVYFRSLKSLSSNLTLAKSADDDYLEITTTGEPNTGANLGSGAQSFKDKVGETLNFRSIVQGNNITVAQSANEISLSVPDGGGLSLTTTGTSGAATLTSGVLNVPNYNAGADTRPYTSYVALLNQTGTSAPTATILENTTGNSIVWSYITTGQYRAVWGSALADVNKVFFSPALGQFKNQTVVVNIFGASTTEFVLSTQEAGALDDDVLLRTGVEIRIYS